MQTPTLVPVSVGQVTVLELVEEAPPVTVGNAIPVVMAIQPIAVLPVRTVNTVVTDIPGPQGEQGAQGIQGEQGLPGSTWFQGEGLPSNLVGNNGDFYLNVTTGDVYEKLAGVWF